MPLHKCKNCNKAIVSTGKNQTTPWIHLDTGWASCRVGVGRTEPSD